MYLRINGIQSGPFAPEDVSDRHARGELDRHAMSWSEGEPAWMSLGKRWPVAQPKWRRVLATIIAMAAVAAALAMPVALETLPASLQNGTLLWCCIIVLLAIAALCLHAAGRGNRRPRQSLRSVVLAIVLAGCGVLAMARAGLDYAVLRLRQHADNAVVSFDASRNAIRIDGPIGPRLPEQMRRMLIRHPDASGIELNSPGGLVADALKVAAVVGARGLPARVDGECASACVAIWAASPHHQMTASSRLGLHQIRFELDLPYQIVGKAKGQLKQEYDALLRGAGFDEQIIEEKDRTTPAHVFWLDPVQVADSGVPLEIYSGGVPVSPNMARWLWLESALAKTSPMRRLMTAIRAHAAPLVAGHAAELYATFHARDGDAARSAGRSLSDDAKQFALARASDQAVSEWGKSLRDIFDRALAQHDGYQCALLSGREPPVPQDKHEATELADAFTDRLASLVETLPADAAELAPATSSTASREVEQRARQDAQSKGYPSQPKLWSVSQRCAYLADYYRLAMQLPIHQAADVLRYTKR